MLEKIEKLGIYLALWEEGRMRGKDFESDKMFKLI